MEKRIREWLDHLPKDIKERAVINMNNEGRDNKIVSSLHKAIDMAFHWEGSYEKTDYWTDVYKDAENGKYNQSPIKGIKKKLML